MSIATTLSQKARSPGDPKVLSTGPSSLTNEDRTARALGWFSIGLGLSELLMARGYTRTFGVEGRETLVRLCGVREIGAGVLSLSVSKSQGLWSRVAGDTIDIALLVAALGTSRRRGRVAAALVAVLGITALDVVAAQAVSARHARRGQPRDYSDRSGFPRGLGQGREGYQRRYEPPVLKPQDDTGQPMRAPSGNGGMGQSAAGQA